MMPVQATIAIVVVCVLAMMLVRTIGDMLVLWNDVVQRYRRHRWEARLWRDVGRSLEADRKAIQRRRLRKV